ncbi:hypothetical protein NIES3585_34450 [Nodularia sp. NIES-3585]|nr:hypothetical protein NIES3585_34450 [Nodularia sp. NIES-3585]
MRQNSAKRKLPKYLLFLFIYVIKLTEIDVKGQEFLWK